MSIVELFCLERRAHVEALTKDALVFGRQPESVEQFRVIDKAVPSREPGNRGASLIGSVRL